MAKTKLFKNGNSQAVRIPAELAYRTWDLDLVIERQRDELRIRPAKRRMGDVLGNFAKFSPHFMAQGRGQKNRGRARSFMNSKYMPDTNICIYLMKHQPPEVRDRFAACFVGDVLISAVTLAELEFGIACSSPAVQAANQLALENLLDDIMVAPFDAQAAKAYGPMRAANKERKRDALDKLIASHAIALGVTLVTNKEADFDNFAGLQVENWVGKH